MALGNLPTAVIRLPLVPIEDEINQPLVTKGSLEFTENSIWKMQVHGWGVSYVLLSINE